MLGCITGFISAFFGIGGSSIDTPLLRTFLHLPPHVALGTPLPLSVLTASIAFVAYRKERLVNMRDAAYSVAAGAPGIAMGSYLTRYLSGKFRMLFTASVLFLIGSGFTVKNLRAKPVPAERASSRPPAAGVAALALAIGLVSGVLANGGGIFFVPAFVVFFRMGVREAIATTLAVVMVLAVPGSIVHYRPGHVDPVVCASMAAGAAPMAYLGAIADIRARSKTVGLLYGLVVSVFSVYFFVSQM